MPKTKTPARPKAKIKKSAPEVPLRFRFTADRFGYRPGNVTNTAAFAKQIIEAIDNWERTVSRLFGNAQLALNDDHAVKAGILPNLPKWKDIADYRSTARRELELTRPGENAEDVELDIQTRYAVEELRLYLEDLYEWTKSFQTGVWAAIVAGIGSLAEDIQTRSLQGLETLAALAELEFDPKTEHRDVWDKLRGPLSDDLIPLNPASMEPSHTFGSFAEEPSRINSWLESLETGAKKLSTNLSAVWAKPDLWPQVERQYWRQWRWPSAAVVTRAEESPDITILDLIYTARHGGIPVVPPRGGRLSIGQLSRIFNLARTARNFIPSDIEGIVATNLGIPELTESAPKIRESDTLLVAIRPRSSQSPAWTWGPQTAVQAVSLMPADVADADRAATEAIRAGTVSASQNILEDFEVPIEEALAKLYRQNRSIVEFVELGDDAIVDRSARRHLGVPSDRVFFGYGQAPLNDEPYVRAPGDLPDLLERARKDFGHLFPLPEPPKEGLWPRIVWQLRLPWAILTRTLRRTRFSIRRRSNIAGAFFVRLWATVNAARMRMRQ